MSESSRVEWAMHLFSFFQEAQHIASTQFHVERIRPYARDFANWLQQYVALFGPLSLRVRPFSLLLDGHAIYRDEEEQHLPFQLYQEGVVGLTFAEALTEEDAFRLFSICLSPGLESELSVKLWELELPALHMFQMEQTDPLNEEVAWEQEQIVETLQFQMLHDSLAGANFMGLVEDARSTTLREGPPALSGNGQEGLLTAEQCDELQALIAQEETTLAARAGELFLLVMTQIEEVRDVETLEVWLVPVAEALLKKQAWEPLYFLLGDVLEIGQASRPELSQAYEQLQRNLLCALTSPSSLSLIAEGCDCCASLSYREKGGLQTFLHMIESILGVTTLEALQELCSAPLPISSTEE
jgi:hypothetical protein